MSKFGFDKVLQNIEMVKRQLPKMVANDTKNYFLNSFRVEAWDGKAWELPKRRKKKNPKGRDLSKTLVQSGKLRRAVSNSLKAATWEVIRFDVTDVNYAEYNNFGTSVNPQRQFMGHTKELTKIQEQRIKNYTDKIWR